MTTQAKKMQELGTWCSFKSEGASDSISYPAIDHSQDNSM